MWSATFILIMVPLNLAQKHSPFSQEVIDIINQKATTWKAGQNFHPLTSIESVRHLMGELPPEAAATIPEKPPTFRDREDLIPPNFDARKQWPNCSTIGEIRDQGGCGSCWAVATAAALSDRMCIHSRGQKIVQLSAEDLISCCEECREGCRGGSSKAAWLYWTTNGIVTGGDYNSNKGCRPYPFPPCDHIESGTSNLPPCDTSVEPPICKHQCITQYDIEYNADKYYGQQSYSVPSKEEEIQREILQNGPLTSVMTVYEDFFNYKEGIYIHVHGDALGRHAIKILGWGSNRGLPYWLVANSWNSVWGENGYFKILRGTNHCEVEGAVAAGIPKLTF